ncbi:MAG: hypothetical protein EXQ58_05060 [Acidobacteria bacterium]|nr:hypothetical protein [Acidobacteriota bacterium]
MKGSYQFNRTVTALEPHDGVTGIQLVYRLLVALAIGPFMMKRQATKLSIKQRHHGWAWVRPTWTA